MVELLFYPALRSSRTRACLLEERQNLGQNGPTPEHPVEKRKMPAVSYEQMSSPLLRDEGARHVSCIGLARRRDVVVLSLDGHERSAFDGSQIHWPPPYSQGAREERLVLEDRLDVLQEETSRKIHLQKAEP